MREMYDRQAKERQAAAGEHGKEGGRGHKKTLPENLPEGLGDVPKGGDARDKVGEVVGVSGKTIDMATKVLKEGNGNESPGGRRTAVPGASGSAKRVRSQFSLAPPRAYRGYKTPVAHDLA
jgi:hypothetical protein